jgi:hypothetical protein
VYWQTSWCHRDFNCLVYRQLSSNLWSCKRSYLPIQPFSGLFAVWYVSYQSLSCSRHTDLDYGLYRLSNLEIEAHRRCDQSTRDAYSSMATWSHLWYIQRFLPLIYSEVRLCPVSWFVYPLRLMRLIAVRYFCHFIIFPWIIFNGNITMQYFYIEKYENQKIVGT